MAAQATFSTFYCRTSPRAVFLPQQRPERRRRTVLAVSAASSWDRRQLLLSWMSLIAASGASQLTARPATAASTTGAALPPAAIRPSLAPDQSLYDAADPRLREAGRLVQQALAASSVEEEERLWTVIVDKFGGLDAPWASDVVGRALSNRGNARSRQGRLEEALADMNAAIEVCPWSVDPVLNRGVVLEALGRWPEALADYDAVLAVAPNDPSAWNNRGNTLAGMGRWEEAASSFGHAAALAPEFSFARANESLALYQLGQDNRAIKEMRRYPEFPDMRAALAGALWEAGLRGEAETEWARVDDPRYRDPAWLRSKRRWPPRLVEDIEALLAIRGVR